MCRVVKPVRDSMKVSGICLMVLICAVALISGVSAQSLENNAGYVVTPAQNLQLPSVVRPMSIGTIGQGQTVWYSKYVSPGTSSLTTDLNWGDPATSLTLTIVAPDATLGPFNDASDGTTNGRIYLSVSKSTGLTAGTWNFKIYGERVMGVTSYSFAAM